MTAPLWKREFDGIIARKCHNKEVNAIYGKSILDLVNLFDADGTPIVDYSTDELAGRQAATAARASGLIQAWSLAEGPQGFACIMVRFDGAAVRNIETTPARAYCWALLEVCQRRN